MKSILLFSFVFGVALNVKALDSSIYQYRFLIDSTNLSFEQIKSIPDSAFTQKTNDKNYNKHPYWIRCKVYNPNPFISYFINSPFIFYKSISLYYELNGISYSEKAGINDFFNKKPYISGSQLFELPNYKDTIVCHIKCEPFFDSFLELVVLNSKQVVGQFNRRFPEFFSMGFTFLAVIFSLLLFIYLKEKTYLYYIFFSGMILISRMVHSGDIFNFMHLIMPISNIHQIYVLYTASYSLLSITTLLYFKQFLNINSGSPYQINKIISSIIIFRLFGLALFLFSPEYSKIAIGGFSLDFNNRIVDFALLLFLLPMTFIAYLQSPKFKTIILLAFIGSCIMIVGNFINLFEISNDLYDAYTTYLHINSLEVVLFLAALGYRHHFLKKENENALLLVIEKMKETEHLKDAVNRELEQKVAERTEEIRQMNELLKKHNIELAHKAEDATKARLFQENMSYEEFKNIFEDDEACINYLTGLKWGNGKEYQCKKCGYEQYKILENQSRRCRSCNYIESPTNGTLFFNTKFSLHKAFYITYLTSTGTKQMSMEEISKEIDLRTGTYWKFHKKVQETLEKFKKSKKRKDGSWTQLIEFSLE